MIRFYSLAVLFFISGFTLRAQDISLQWAYALGNSAADFISIVKQDDDGFVYVAGQFSSTVDFDLSSAVYELTSAGGRDAFVAKYSGAGELQWAIPIGSTGWDAIFAMDVDANGSVFVGGSFVGTVDFNPASSVNTLSSNADTRDGFYARYATDGTFLWVNRIGSADTDVVYGLVVDNASNIYVTGFFMAAADFDPGTGILTKTPIGGTDIFLAKYSYSTGAGTLVWANAMGSTGDDVGLALATNNTDVWIVGSYKGSINMNPAGTTQTATNLGLKDGFFGQYAGGTGLMTWFGSIRGTGDDEITSIAVDGSGNLYTGGTFAGSASMYGSGSTSVALTSNGNQDGFVAKHVNSTSTLSWIQKIGGTNYDFVKGIDFSDDEIFVIGDFSGTVEFRIDGSPTNVTSAGSYDIFVSNYDQFGVYDGTQIISGVDNQTSTSICATEDGYLIGGYIYGITDMDPTSSIYTITPNGTTEADGFVARYVYTNLDDEPTLPATGLVFSAVTSTSFNYDFSHAAGSHDGYLQLRKAGSPPTFIPIDGMSYNDGETLSDGSYVPFNDNIPSGNFANDLTPGTTYYFKIYVYNGSGSTTNYLTSSVLSGNVTTLGGSGTPEPTAQPTNLTFSNITKTGYGFSFTAATGAPAGYIGIRRVGSATSFVPVDGTTYTVGQDTGTGTVNFIGAGTSYSQSNAAEGTTYHLTIFSYNGTGSAINYRQASPLVSSVTTLTDDITPPAITNNTITKTPPNATVKISVSVVDTGSGVSEVYLDYYSINSENGGYEPMVNTTGNTWEFVIPASFNTEQGVEYNVAATDIAGNYSETDWKQVLVEHTGNGLIIPYTGGGESANGYRIISIPLTLEKKSANDVLGDDLGNYDKSVWRLFNYSGGKNTELSGSSSMDIGKGFWLITKNKGISLDTGPGTTASVGIGRPFTVSLTSGWNLIGNPYNFNLNWSDIVGISENSALSLGNLRVYTGSWANGTQFTKFSGGFVMAQGSGGTLTIPVYVDTRTKEEPVVDFNNTLDAPVWAASLKLSSGSIINEFAGIGMHPSAADDNDRYDDFTLPRFMEYLELNHEKKLYGAPFTRDIVPTQNEYEWRFEVSSNLPEDIISMTWDNAYFGKNEMQLVLWDENQQRAVDMKTVNSYSFNRRTSGLFRIFFGKASYVKDHTMPWQPSFHSVSPVPAIDNVNFAFSVPESGGSSRTSLVVYNLLGQPVATIVDDILPGGYHEASWKINDVSGTSTGVYISVLRFGNELLQKRLVIK